MRMVTHVCNFFCYVCKIFSFMKLLVPPWQLRCLQWWSQFLHLLCAVLWILFHGGLDKLGLLVASNPKIFNDHPEAFHCFCFFLNSCLPNMTIFHPNLSIWYCFHYLMELETLNYHTRWMKKTILNVVLIFNFWFVWIKMSLCYKIIGLWADISITKGFSICCIDHVNQFDCDNASHSNQVVQSQLRKYGWQLWGY